VAEHSPNAKQFEDFAFKCGVFFVGIFAAMLLDGYDGVVSGKGGVYRLAEDPKGFWITLFFPLGYFGAMALIGMLAAGVGALVLKAPGKASGQE